MESGQSLVSLHFFPFFRSFTAEQLQQSVPQLAIQRHPYPVICQLNDRSAIGQDRQTDKHYNLVHTVRKREAQLCRFLLLPLFYPSLPPFPLADRLSVGTAFAAKVVRLTVLVELLIDNLFSRAPLELLLVNTPLLNAKLNAFSAVRRRKGKGENESKKSYRIFSLLE